MDVQVIKTGFPSIVAEGLPEGATVDEALNEVGISREGYSLHVSGNPADASTVLQDDDTIVLVTKVKGGVASLYLLKFGEDTKELEFEPGETLAAIFNRYGIVAGTGGLTIDGDPATLQTVPEDDAFVNIVPKVKGGA